MPHDDAALELWTEHFTTPCERTLTALVEHYQPLAVFLARRAKAKAPAWQALDELVSFAYDGLLDAIQKYDAAREVKFDTYATRRIAGAILDGQRSLDPLSRRQRTAVREYEEALETLQLALGRRPSLEELAEALETTPENVRSRALMVKSAAGQLFESGDLRELNGADEQDDSYLYDTSWYEGAEVALGADELDVDLRREELRRLVSRSLPKLDARQRTVVLLYYGEGLNYDQISKVVGIHPNRCRETRKAALQALAS